MPQILWPTWRQRAWSLAACWLLLLAGGGCLRHDPPAMSLVDTGLGPAEDGSVVDGGAGEGEGEGAEGEGEGAEGEGEGEGAEGEGEGAEGEGEGAEGEGEGAEGEGEGTEGEG
ncbi:MAG: hypothetical protein RBU45_26180, partial [Myxococcota bacterium]|nr:hypothetical protein [Myxococcota bacterium]